MRKQRWILLCLLLMLTFWSGCHNEEAGTQETSQNTIRIYYTNETATTLQEEDLKVEAGLSTRQRVDAVLSALKNPPEGLVSIIPQDFYISYTIERAEMADEESLENLSVYAAGDYDRLTPNVENVFRVGLMKSLIRMSDVNSIELYVNRINEQGTYVQTRISYLTQDTVIVNEADENFFQDNVDVTLYFVNEAGDQLVREVRSTVIQMSERIEEKVVTMLIEGPQIEGHRSVLPTGTAVNEVLVRNGVCYVDMNEAFVRNQVGGEPMESLTIYSIVNSLTQLYGVDSVQFLIDGQQREFYKTNVKINTPLEFNGSLIREE